MLKALIKLKGTIGMDHKNIHYDHERVFKACYTSLFESHPDASFLQTAEGKIIDCNVAAVKSTGYSREELLELGIHDIIQDDIIQYISPILSGGISEHDVGVTSLCRKKNGDSFPVALDLRLLRKGEDVYIFTMLRDITLQRKTEDECESLRNQLEQTRKMEVVGRLAGGISHYYNNIFTGIIGALTLAQRDAPPKVLSLLKQAERTAHLASGFTRRILAFSRTSRIVREPIDMRAVIDDAVQFAHLTFDRCIHVEIKKQDNLYTVLADASSIHHVLLDLMVNARDALLQKQRSVSWTPKLSMFIEACNVQIDENYIRIHPQAQKGHYVRVSVSDTGCGMTSETQKRLFEPFFTTKEPGKGTGLGLSTSLNTVKEHQGWFEFFSVPGKGSTFTFFLPKTSLKKTPALQYDIEDLPNGTETILLVDDDEMIRTFVTLSLERQGYKVITAVDGEECLELFMKERKRIELIILDLVLPVLSGRTVLKKIRSIDPTMRFIISSGQDLSGERETFAELGADDYILKPFHIVDLLTSVREVLDRSTR